MIKVIEESRPITLIFDIEYNGIIYELTVIEKRHDNIVELWINEKNEGYASFIIGLPLDGQDEEAMEEAAMSIIKSGYIEDKLGELGGDTE